jgi:hypothetical protein
MACGMKLSITDEDLNSNKKYLRKKNYSVKIVFPA